MYGIHIEPLHKDPLNKNFPCKKCGKLFRTRQGLSGHIQFKHGTKKNTLAIATKDILDIKIKLKSSDGRPKEKRRCLLVSFKYQDLSSHVIRTV